MGKIFLDKIFFKKIIYNIKIKDFCLMKVIINKEKR